MKVRFTAILLALVSAAVISGCVSSKEYSEYRREVDSRPFLVNYADTWKDWFCDMGDVASLEFSAGQGIGVYAQPTKLANAGVIFSDVMKLGFRKRGIGFYREVRKEGGATWFYYRDLEYDPIIGTRGLFDKYQRLRSLQDFTIRHNADRHWCDVGYEFNAVFFGNSFFVSPYETFDFLASTVLMPYNLILRVPLSKAHITLPEIDIGDDDTVAQIRREHDVELIPSHDNFPPAETLDELMDFGW